MVRRLIFRNAFVDKRGGEVANRMDRKTLITKLSEIYGVVDFADLLDVVPGEILFDSRGRGSMQKVEAPSRKIKASLIED